MSSKAYLVFLVLTILSLPMASSHSGGVLGFKDILPEEPSSYDKMRPPKKDGRPTVVYFHVTVMSLDSINENSMTYAADIFFAQSWKDHRLRLPENMTSEYRLLEVDWLGQMWRPDSFFKNAKQVTFQTMTIPNHYVWLYQSKSILYMVKLTLTLSCAMNYMIYPHDTQECKLQMESLSHTTEDLIFEWDPEVPLVVDENIELPQFNLVNNRTADCSQDYSTALMEYALVNLVLGDSPDGTVVIKKNTKDSPSIAKKTKDFLPSLMSDIKRGCSGISSGKTQTLDIPLSTTTFHSETANDQMNLNVSSPRSSATGVEIVSRVPQPSPVYSLHHETRLMSCSAERHCHHSPNPHPHNIYPDTRQRIFTSPPSCRHTECQLSAHVTPMEHHCSETHFCDYYAQLQPEALCERHSFTLDHLFGPHAYCPHAVHSHSCHANYHCSPQYSEKRDQCARCSSICSAYNGPSQLFRHDSTRVSSPCLVRRMSSKENKRGRRGECPLERRSRSVEKPLERSATKENPFLDPHSEKSGSRGSGEYLPEMTRKRSSSAKRVVLIDKNIQTDEWNEVASIKPTLSPLGSTRRGNPSTFDNIQIPPEETAASTLLSVPPPPPPPNKNVVSSPAQKAQKRRARAIMVDRFSRVFFPSTFGLINAVYWIILWIYL